VGSWLEGPQRAAPEPGTWRGQSLGLPETGPGSVATQGRKLGAAVLDLVAAYLIGVGASLVLARHPSPLYRTNASTVAWLVEIVVLSAFQGQTIGMRLAHLCIVGPDGARPRLRWMLLRTLIFLIPFPGVTALAQDANGRGLHDRASGTVVVRA